MTTKSYSEDQADRWGGLLPPRTTEELTAYVEWATSRDLRTALWGIAILSERAGEAYAQTHTGASEYGLWANAANSIIDTTARSYRKAER